MCDDESKLPRSAFERVGFGFVSLFMLIFFGFGTLVLLLTPMPPLGVLFTLVLIATQELFLAATVIAALGIVWAVAMPLWLEKLYCSALKHLSKAILLGFIMIVLVGFWVKNGAGFGP